MPLAFAIKELVFTRDLLQTYSFLRGLLWSGSGFRWLESTIGSLNVLA